MAIEHLQFWHWWLLALGLLILELTAAGTFYLLWVAFAAAVVGGVMLVMSPSWEVQFGLFAALSMISVWLWHRYRPVQKPSDQPTLNRRGDSYVGRVFTLDTPIVNGIGKLHVDDTQWRIAGDDVAAGAKVRVIGVEGSTLKVEKAN